MGSELQVLIATGSDAEAQRFASVLEKTGWLIKWRRVDTLDAAEQALSGSSFDLLLADEALPQLPAVPLLEFACAQEPGLAALVIADQGGESRTAAAVRAGAYELIPRAALDRLPEVARHAVEDARTMRAADSQRLAAGLEASHAVMLLIDPESERIVYANQAACDYYGYSRRVLQRMKIGQINLLGPESRQQMARAVALQTFHFLFKHRLASGEVRDVEVFSGPIKRAGRPLLYSIVHDVTEQRRAEEELRRSEARIDAFFDSSPAALAIFDSDLRLIRINRTAAVTFGRPPEQLIGKTAAELGSRFARSDEPTLRGILETGEPLVGVEFAAKPTDRPDGQRYWFASYFPIVLPGGAREVGITAFDITERRRATDALQEARMQSETLHHLLLAITSTLDTGEILRRVLDESTRAVGVEASAIITREGDEWTIRHVVNYPPSVIGIRVPASQMKVATLAANQLKPLAIEDALHDPRASGETMARFGVRSTLVVPLSTRGHVHGVIHYIVRSHRTTFTEKQLAFAARLAQAISLALENARIFEERQRLLEETAERAAELDAALSSVATGLIVYEPDGRIVRMNVAAVEMLRYRNGQAGQLLDERMERLRPRSPDGAPLWPGNTPQERILRGETVRDETVLVHADDGTTRWLSFSGAPIRTPDGRLLGAIATFNDITELHELQVQREVYVHTVSHDLRNPLSLIQGHARLLAGELSRSEGCAGLQGRVDAIQRSARQMGGLIEDLVEAARKEGGQLQLSLRPLDLESWCRELLARSEVGMQTERVRLSVEPGLPAVLADPDRLERVLVNLLSNALKFSPEGAPVDLEIGRSSGQAKLTVRDRGPGIDPDEQSQLFRRFFRGRAGGRAKGVGLGLYVARTLVEAHGGRLWVESEPGKGAAFSLLLPFAPQELPQQPADQP